jgi:hypothetical protein
MVTKLALQAAAVASLAAGAGFITGSSPTSSIEHGAVRPPACERHRRRVGLLAFQNTGEAIEEVESAAARRWRGLVLRRRG